MNPWKPILAALVIFAAGVLTGGFTANLDRVPRDEARRGFARIRQERSAENGFGQLPWNARIAEGQVRDLSVRMGHALELAPAQRERIQAILHEGQARMKSIADEYAPRTREEMRLLREQIRQELTPEQRRQFETLFKPRDGRPRRADPSPSTPSLPETGRD